LLVHQQFDLVHRTQTVFQFLLAPVSQQDLADSCLFVFDSKQQVLTAVIAVSREAGLLTMGVAVVLGKNT